MLQTSSLLLPAAHCFLPAFPELVEGLYFPMLHAPSQTTGPFVRAGL